MYSGWVRGGQDLHYQGVRPGEHGGSCVRRPRWVAQQHSNTHAAHTHTPSAAVNAEHLYQLDARTLLS